MKFLKSLEVLLTSRNAEMHIWLKCLGVSLLPPTGAGLKCLIKMFVTLFSDPLNQNVDF